MNRQSRHLVILRNFCLKIARGHKLRTFPYHALNRVQLPHVQSICCFFKIENVRTDSVNLYAIFPMRLIWIACHMQFRLGL